MAAPERRLRTTKVYAYGVSQNRLRHSAKSLAVPLILTDELGEADTVITLKSFYRKRPAAISDAEARRIPVYVLRSNTYNQIEGALVDIFGVQSQQSTVEGALQEVRDAIYAVLSGRSGMVELAPRTAPIRRQQHALAREANVLSLSHGVDPHRRVRLFRNDRLTSHDLPARDLPGDGS